MISCQVLAAKVKWQTPKRFPLRHLTSLVRVTKVGPVRFVQALYCNVTVVARSQELIASRRSEVDNTTFLISVIFQDEQTDAGDAVPPLPTVTPKAVKKPKTKQSDPGPGPGSYNLTSTFDRKFATCMLHDNLPEANSLPRYLDALVTNARREVNITHRYLRICPSSCNNFKIEFFVLRK